jgi:hypothetical protein
MVMEQQNIFAEVTPQLRHGEKTLWAERPKPVARALTKIAPGLFGIPFFCFAIFWIFTAVGMGGGILMALFGLPFVLVGAALMLSPLWSYLEAKSWLVYAITDRRLLIIRTFPRNKVESFEPADITRLTRTSKADGSGNVIFAEDVRQDEGRSYKVPRGFYGIPEAKRVEEAVIALRDSVRDSTDQE